MRLRPLLKVVAVCPLVFALASPASAASTGSAARQQPGDLAELPVVRLPEDPVAAVRALRSHMGDADFAHLSMRAVTPGVTRADVIDMFVGLQGDALVAVDRGGEDVPAAAAGGNVYSCTFYGANSLVRQALGNVEGSIGTGGEQTIKMNGRTFSRGVSGELHNAGSLSGQIGVRYALSNLPAGYGVSVNHYWLSSGTLTARSEGRVAASAEAFATFKLSVNLEAGGNAFGTRTVLERSVSGSGEVLGTDNTVNLAGNWASSSSGVPVAFTVTSPGTPTWVVHAYSKAEAYLSAYSPGLAADARASIDLSSEEFRAGTHAQQWLISTPPDRIIVC